MQETGGQDSVARSQAGTAARSNLPADGTMAVSTRSASSQQKPSPSAPRGGAGLTLRSPVDGGPRPQQTTGTVARQSAERLPVYGSSVSDRRSFPPDGSGSAEQRSSGGGGGSSRPVLSSTAAASASAQVTFQDPIESKSCVIQFCYMLFLPVGRTGGIMFSFCPSLHLWCCLCGVCGKH